MTNPYDIKRYYCMALDPIHVGTGGYRLGRVDNTIVREPGTDLPKIPGTSISGVARAYTAMQHENKYQREKKDSEGKVVKDDKGNTLFESCAGKGGKDGEGHCANGDCPVCIPYGFTKKSKSLQGMAQFSDARLLFFPVHSMVGPVWITSPSILRDLYLKVEEIDDRMIKLIDPSLAKQSYEKKYILNLGWLMLERASNTEGEGKFSLEVKDGLDDELKEKVSADIKILKEKIPEIVEKRLILVSDRIFSQVVNDNLEIRTSVSIDPLTGAAEEGALFTYEAIPRGTIFWFHVLYHDPKKFQVDRKPIGTDISWVKEEVERGLSYIEYMGIGGMNTRGMGRMRIL